MLAGNLFYPSRLKWPKVSSRREKSLKKNPAYFLAHVASQIVSQPRLPVCPLRPYFLPSLPLPFLLSVAA